MGVAAKIRPWVPALLAVFAALSLLAPWTRSGTVDRSTIDMLSSASALQLLDGTSEVIALLSWFLVPVLAAGAVISVGWGRVRLMSAFALPIGPMMGAAWWAVATSPLEVRWGAVFGGICGLTTSALAVLILMGTKNSVEGR